MSLSTETHHYDGKLGRIYRQLVADDPLAERDLPSFNESIRFLRQWLDASRLRGDPYHHTVRKAIDLLEHDHKGNFDPINGIHVEELLPRVIKIVKTFDQEGLELFLRNVGEIVKLALPTRTNDSIIGVLYSMGKTKRKHMRRMSNYYYLIILYIDNRYVMSSYVKWILDWFKSLLSHKEQLLQKINDPHLSMSTDIRQQLMSSIINNHPEQFEKNFRMLGKSTQQELLASLHGDMSSRGGGVDIFAEQIQLRMNSHQNTTKTNMTKITKTKVMNVDTTTTDMVMNMDMRMRMSKRQMSALITISILPSSMTMTITMMITMIRQRSTIITNHTRRKIPLTSEFKIRCALYIFMLVTYRNTSN